MSNTQNPRDLNSLPAGEDLSAKQYYIVQQNASGNVEVGEGATDLILGVLQNTPESGEMATYAKGGVCKVVSDGTGSIGSWVTSDASGKATPTTTDGDIVIGKLLEAPSADGDIVKVDMHIHHLYIA